MKAMRKDFVREIRNTRSRFISILILVALAVAFLAGLRATSPDMKLTLDAYLDSQDFMDVQVLSTLGVTEEDVEYLSGLDGVSGVEGSRQLDAFAAGKDSDLVAKLWSVPEKINRLVVRQGRLPQAENECAIEQLVVNKLGLNVGDTIVITPGEDDSDKLKCSEFTITGLVSSPYYISVERGSSTLGTGSVSACIWLADCAFDVDYYTAAYLTLEDALSLDAFYDEYEKLVDDWIDRAEPLGDLRAELRYESIVGEAEEKLNDAQTELDDARAEADKELGDAENELSDARTELDNGWQEYYDGLKELENARNELADGRSELADARQKIAEGESELSDAEKTLADARQSYEDGLAEYEEGKAEFEENEKKLKEGLEIIEKYEKELADGRAELEEGRAELETQSADGLKALEDAKKTLEDGEAQYSDGLRQYNDGIDAYVQGAKELEESKAQLAAAGAELEAQTAILEQSELYLNTQLEAAAAAYGITADMLKSLLAAKPELDPTGTLGPAIAALEQGKAGLAAYKAEYEKGLEAAAAGEQTLKAAADEIDKAAAVLEYSRKELDDGWDEYENGLTEYEEEMAKAEAQLADAEAELKDAEAELAEKRAELEAGQAELEEGRQKLADAEKELAEGLLEIEDGEKKLADAKAELEDAKQQYADGVKELTDGETEIADGEKELTDALAELEDGEKEYADGLAEYEEGKAEAEEKMIDAQSELDDARKKLEDIGDCTWYILNRDSNPGYLGFGQDADRMGNLAKVFPVLFFLVAALVCLTTMTRMVEEQRTQIGCLKALGYSRLAISSKYLLYGAVPAILGALAGLVIGYILFPKMIFTAYQIMYDVPDLGLRQYTGVSLFSIGTALVCTVGSSLSACLAALRAVPAQLMRPKAPKPGKRVLLEYIRPLWKRMGFFSKVTVRNLFRYQKRFWMTVAGIGGCTALIIAGFGLRSSLISVMDMQYDELYRYHVQITVDSNISDEDRGIFEDYTSGNEDIVRYIETRFVSANAVSDDYSVYASVQVYDPEELAEFVDIHDYDTKQTIELDSSGAVIDKKLSELLGVEAGDLITVENNGFHEVRVSAVTEHYLGHVVYMTEDYYEECFDEAASVNTYLMMLTSDSAELCDSIFSDMMKLNGVSAATRIEDTRDTYQHSMERIDFVVVIVILSAAALAMVVLYNLSNINITERKRELATIKVLGFYDLEVTEYIYRENVVLTLLGIIAGILMGKVLHQWLVRSVEIDLMMFGRRTDPKAFLWASLLTLLFSAVVNVAGHRKMKKIDMVESLKSAE